MRRNLLLVVLVFSMVFFFSSVGFAQTNEYSLVPVDLKISPCAACPLPNDGTVDNLVEVDININVVTTPVAVFVVPLAVTGSSLPILDSVLTGGATDTFPWNGVPLTDSGPPGMADPSKVARYNIRVVYPYGIGGPGGPYTFPMNFVAVTFGSPLGIGTSGLYCKLFFRVACDGDIIFNTMVNSAGQSVSMNDAGGNEIPINWGPTQEVGRFDVTRTPEQAPVVACGGRIDKFVNDVIPINISATDAGGTPIKGIFLKSPGIPCGSGSFDHTNPPSPWVYTWNTAGCTGSSGTLTFGVFDECETTYCEVPFTLVAAAVFVQIGCITGNPGDIVDIPVQIKALKPLGGFDLRIEFDPTTLYFKGVTWKDLDGFEYKTYRQLPCPMCGCCKYKLELIGIYDIKNLHQGVPIQPSDTFITIASLDFQIASDQNLRGFDLNVCFEFDEGLCTQNSFTDSTGNVLYVSDDTNFFNFVDCPIQDDQGLNPVLPLAHFNLFAPPCTENPLGRPCGGVFIPTTGEKKRGDINLNLIAYEVGDAVLFSSYFIYGTNVFILDKPVQIANTDINADGYPLGLSDFVLMLRIMAHDATPIPKPTPGSDLATIYMIGDKVSTNANLGAALFVFKGDVKVSTDLKNVQGVVDGQTRVLVYMNSNTGMTGQLLTAEGKLVSVEAVDNFSRPVKTTVVERAIPTAYALNANYPNPFNPTTNISFALPIDSKVSLKIYNVAGQLVRTLVNETMVAGTHTVTWDGINSNGEKVASGIYFYKLNAGDFSKTMKMVMTK